MKDEIVQGYISGVAVCIFLALVCWFSVIDGHVDKSKRTAFRVGYKQYEIYDAEQRDKYGNIGTFSKGWEDAEIDSILKARE